MNEREPKHRGPTNSKSSQVMGKEISEDEERPSFPDVHCRQATDGLINYHVKMGARRSRDHIPRATRLILVDVTTKVMNNLKVKLFILIPKQCYNETFRRIMSSVEVNTAHIIDVC